MDEATLREAKSFLIAALRIPDMGPDELEDDTALFGGGLGLDSIDALAIVVALDKTYGIKIPNAAAGEEHLRSVRTLAALIRSAEKADPD